MVRRLRRAAGTVEQAATPVTSTASPASSPRNINPSSSAVDRASVLIRQLCTSLSPSKVASTVLVFPMSIQSSTGRFFLGFALCSASAPETDQNCHPGEQLHFPSRTPQAHTSQARPPKGEPPLNIVAEFGVLGETGCGQTAVVDNDLLVS